MGDFHPITAESVRQGAYIQFPKAFFSAQYATLSLGAKLAWAILRDRVGLSLHNGWTDDEGLVYVCCSRDALAHLLACTKKTAIRYMAELTEYRLIREARGSTWSPNRIYVGLPDGEYDPNAQEWCGEHGEEENSVVTKGDHDGEETTPQWTQNDTTEVSPCPHDGVEMTPARCKNDTGEVNFLHPNKTEYNKTEYSKTNTNTPPTPPRVDEAWWRSCIDAITEEIEENWPWKRDWSRPLRSATWRAVASVFSSHRFDRARYERRKHNMINRLIAAKTRYASAPDIVPHVERNADPVSYVRDIDHDVYIVPDVGAPIVAVEG